MSLEITGTGWVTPLGYDLSTVWERLAAKEHPEVKEIGEAVSQPRPYLPIPTSPSPIDASLARVPRIRRSSVITLYGVAAGIAALRNAGLEMSPEGALSPEVAERTAVIFAVCSGGVNYTRRFYEKVVAEGPSGASPLLFPETVYNAPASHLAAVLGTDGITYTLVGDACVGLTAMDYAAELLLTHPEVDQCVVVGTEECDWILWQGYAAWRMLTRESAPRLHSPTPTGMLLSEGAAAVVVRRAGEAPGTIRAKAVARACPQRRDATASLVQALGELPTRKAGLVVGSANGTWIDHAEAAALCEVLPGCPAYYPKALLGENLGASALTQVVVATEALRRGGSPDLPLPGLSEVTVTTLGLNQQVGAAHLTRIP